MAIVQDMKNKRIIFDGTAQQATALDFFKVTRITFYDYTTAAHTCIIQDDDDNEIVKFVAPDTTGKLLDISLDGRWVKKPKCTTLGSGKCSLYFE